MKQNSIRIDSYKNDDGFELQGKHFDKQEDHLVCWEEEFDWQEDH